MKALVGVYLAGMFMASDAPSTTTSKTFNFDLGGILTGLAALVGAILTIKATRKTRDTTETVSQRTEEIAKRTDRIAVSNERVNDTVQTAYQSLLVKHATLEGKFDMLVSQLAYMREADAQKQQDMVEVIREMALTVKENRRLIDRQQGSGEENE